MPLPQSQIKFVEENCKSRKDIRDMVGFFSKDNRKKYYQKKKLEDMKISKSVKDILANAK